MTHLHLTAAIAALVLVVAACGGDSEPAPDDPDASVPSDAPVSDPDASSGPLPGAPDATTVDPEPGAADAAIADAAVPDARRPDAGVDARVPTCGDGACNGTESSSTCCTDCGCPGGYACLGNTCQAVQTCGDGRCTGSETSDSCCRDCGCPGGHACNGSACECQGATVRFTNVMPDREEYCWGTGTWYTQRSVGYMSIDGTLYYMPQSSWVSISRLLGGSYAYNAQCCYLDGCYGNQWCRTPYGDAPCLCANPYVESGRADVCGIEDEPICQ
jgi:hypothetical protein